MAPEGSVATAESWLVPVARGTMLELRAARTGTWGSVWAVEWVSVSKMCSAAAKLLPRSGQAPTLSVTKAAQGQEDNKTHFPAIVCAVSIELSGTGRSVPVSLRSCAGRGSWNSAGREASVLGFTWSLLSQNQTGTFCFQRCRALACSAGTGCSRPSCCRSF